MANGVRGDLYLEFWKELLSQGKKRTGLHEHSSPTRTGDISCWAGTGSRFHYTFSFGGASPYVSLFIRGKRGMTSKQMFDHLYKSKDAIQQRFGAHYPLKWEPLDGAYCRVRFDIGPGAISDKNTWPQLQNKMIDAMIKLENALRPNLKTLE